MAFTPTDLFSGGEGGYWCNLADTAKVYQDSTKATPWASSGNPVGAITKQAGTVADILQSTSGARPQLQINSGNYELVFDGSDDCFENISFSYGTPGAFSWFGYVKYTALGGFHNLIEHTAQDYPMIWFNASNQIEIDGGSGYGTMTPLSYASAFHTLITRDDGVNGRSIWIDGVSVLSNATAVGYKVGAQPMSIFGRSGTSTFNGSIRKGWGCIGRYLTTGEIGNIHGYLTGTLPNDQTSGIRPRGLSKIRNRMRRYR